MGRFIFTVQGEGRGHLTQAISLTQIAREAGHEVVGYALGASEGRVIPSFFLNFIGETPIIQFESPSLNYGTGKSVNIVSTPIMASHQIVPWYWQLSWQTARTKMDSP